MDNISVEIHDKDIDREFILRLIEPYKSAFSELMELVKRFDEELGNVVNNGHLEVSINLGDGRLSSYNYIYYAIIYPDCIEVYREEYSDEELKNGISRKKKVATIYM